jgi:phosphate transport system permease protein
MAAYDDAYMDIPDLEVLAAGEYDELIGQHTDDDPANDRPRRFQNVTPAAALEGAVSVAGGLAIALIFRTLLHWQGLMSTFAFAFVATMALSMVLLRSVYGRLAAADRVMTALIWSVGLLVCSVLAWLLGFVLLKGVSKLSWTFFVDDLGKTSALNKGGGMRHAIIGTIEQVGMATIVSVPIAIMTAVYLNEIKGRMAPLVRFIVDAMSGLPSVVAGLLVYAVWILSLGNGFSGFACSMALLILMLPTVTRTAEEILRTVPDHLREASLALGATRWRTVSRVVLPTARSGLLTAVILGIARAAGETAPAALTTFGSSTTNLNPFTEPQANLPLTVFQLIRSGNKQQLERAYAGACVLILLVLVAFTLARIISIRGQKTRR